jgi:branched-subunit amino acid ABC-type transport system permease component
MSDLTLFSQILWTSLANSSYQVLFTISFALVLKVLGVWNFTQPALMAGSFYCMYIAIDTLGMPPLAGFVISTLFTVAFACAIEGVAFRTLRNRNSSSIAFFIFTIVMSQFVIYLLTLTFTAEPRFLFGNMTSTVYVVASVYITSWDITAMLTTVTLVLTLYLFLNFTGPGQFMIAVADNAELAETYGINKNRYFFLTMLIAAIFISTGTFLFGGKIAFYPELSLHMMLFAVAATIIGGIGSIFGASAAAVIIVVLQQMSVLIIGSRWQPLFVFAILFVTIVLASKGLRFRAFSMK